jgi:hypothetical protein
MHEINGDFEVRGFVRPLTNSIGGTRVLTTGRRLLIRNRSAVLSTRFSGLYSHPF